MIDPKEFYEIILKHSDFITGVPDSLLKDFNSCVLNEHPKNRHIIAPNEGISISLAIGHFISTGKIPTVYMQNSGVGNAINPLLSLADKDVYGVPMVLIIGWRGEPGIKDEPQHLKQGLVQEALLHALQIEYSIIDSATNGIHDVMNQMYINALKDNCPKVLLIRKGTFSSYKNVNMGLNDLESRESAINTILSELGEDSIYVGTTGKASRELYELRVSRSESHANDFLTVGGMGHASAIATGIAMNTNKRVVCLDGDGALLMHMGGLVSTAKYAGKNFVHVILNNGVHESVGGQPTLVNNVDIKNLGQACGYRMAFSVKSSTEFIRICESDIFGRGPVLIEYKVGPESRQNLGRPTQSPKENLESLMTVLK